MPNSIFDPNYEKNPKKQPKPKAKELKYTKPGGTDDNVISRIKKRKKMLEEASK